MKLEVRVAYPGTYVDDHQGANTIELYYACRKRNNVELAVRQSGSEAARRGAERAASAGGDSSSASILKVGNLRLSLFLLEHENEIWQPSAPPPPRSGSAAAVVKARCHFCPLLTAHGGACAARGAAAAGAAAGIA